MKNKILIVDDIKQNLDILEVNLIPLGYEVIRAGNGNEAIQKIEENKDLSLVILDIMMPGIDGIEVCRRINTDFKDLNIPVIMVTGLEDSKTKLKCIESGADDFLTKPFKRAELLARTSSLINKKAAQDELNSSYRGITEIISLTDNAMNNFDPFDFDYKKSNSDLLRSILKNKEEQDDKKPEYVLLTYSHDGSLVGNIFFKERDKVVKLPDKISIPLTSGVAVTFSMSCKVGSPGITCAERELVFSNWHDREDMNIDEYQENFSDKVRKEVGTVRNFITFFSGQLAVVAFNYGKSVSEFDAQILKGFVIHSNFLKTISDQVSLTEEAFLYTIEALARASEANDEDTYTHIIRINEYAKVVATHLKMPEKFIKEIACYAQMHDVGKIHVSRGILRKPAKLTDDEYDEMKLHTVFGARILGDSQRLTMAKEIAHYHHEKFGGGGYPNGIKGEEIPIAARITTIADVYDALRSKRHYKPAFPHEKSFKIITEGDGRTYPEDFDPKILDAFKATETLFDEIFNNIQDDPDKPI